MLLLDFFFVGHKKLFESFVFLSEFLRTEILLFSCREHKERLTSMNKVKSKFDVLPLNKGRVLVPLKASDLDICNPPDCVTCGRSLRSVVQASSGTEMLVMIRQSPAG